MENKTGNEKSLRRRFLAVAVAIVVAFSAICFQLMQLQLRDGSQYAQAAQDKVVTSTVLKGDRGMILDRNGIVLAYDKESYDIEFYKDPAKRKSEYLHAYSQTLLSIIEIVERNGGSTISGFSLKRDENGESYFDFLTTNEETFAKREELWRSNFYLSDTTKYPVEVIFDTLCARYGIEDLPYETQYKVLSIWEEIQMNAFLHTPVKIALDVNFNTVAEIEAAAVDLAGVSVAESTVRVYPWGNTASHVLGYLGAIDESSLATYQELGYSASDLVGVSGIESTMEEQLSGNISYRQGLREAEVDANGSITRELSYQAPVDGNNVVLTIDLRYQQILEEAMQANIEEARNIQMQALEEAEESELEDYQQQIDNRGGKTLQLASSGAAVVMNVHTAEVLAICSYPDYDPNDFIRGMTTEEYNEKYNIDTSPLFNRAIASKSAPGSVFKMVTALAGLQEGVVTVDQEFNSMEAESQREQRGVFIKYGDDSYSPKCWTNHYASEHQNMNVKEAVTMSCNYYFYNVADLLGIDRLVQWASTLGLTSKTGIELPGEATGSVGNQSVLYDPSLGITSQRVEKANYVARTIMKLLEVTGEDLGRNFEEERLENTTKQLMDLVLEYDISAMGTSIREILMRELGLSSYEISSRYMVNSLTTYLRDIKWNSNETVLTGIGQSITEVTPIGVARYICAIANGGTVLEAQIVDKILSSDGAVVTEKEPVVVNQIEGAEEHLSIIREGMHGVISAEDGGTAAKYWSDFPYTDQIGAKTGTAQINQIDIENSAWFVAFAPFDDPEIAIVVSITNGYSGGAASLTSQNVFTYFFEKLQEQEKSTLTQPNSYLP